MRVGASLVVGAYLLAVWGLLALGIVTSVVDAAPVEPEVVEVEVERVVHLSHPLTAIRLGRVSAYNAIPRQTDNDPSTSSCGTTLPNTVALSQDLFFDGEGHKFRCGQVVSVLTDRGEMFLNLTVWDTTHSRFSSTADILWPTNNEEEAHEFGITGGWLIIH